MSNKISLSEDIYIEAMEHLMFLSNDINDKSIVREIVNRWQRKELDALNQRLEREERLEDSEIMEAEEGIEIYGELIAEANKALATLDKLLEGK